MNNITYLANKILKACKAEKIVHVAYNTTFAGVSSNNFAANIKNVLSAIQAVAENEGYGFSLLESKKIKYGNNSGGEYYIDCWFVGESEVYIRLTCSVDLDVSQCRFLLSVIDAVNY